MFTPNGWMELNLSLWGLWFAAADQFLVDLDRALKKTQEVGLAPYSVAVS
jgi:hypothetical protein